MINIVNALLNKILRINRSHSDRVKDALSNFTKQTSCKATVVLISMMNPLAISAVLCFRESMGTSCMSDKSGVGMQAHVYNFRDSLEDKTVSN